MSALLELLKKKKQEMAAANRGRTAKIPDGTSRWRIMGSWRGKDQPFWHDFGQHYVKDAAGTMVAIYMCVDRTFGKPCAVCDAVKQGVAGATDEPSMKLIGDAKSASRVLVNALCLDAVPAGKDPHKVEILEMPPSLFEAFVNISTEWEEAGESILGATGRDVMITRTGAGKLTKYTAQVAAKAVTVPAGICEKLHNLDEYVAQESAEQQARAINGVRAISGLLPAAGASSGMPLAARAGMLLDDEVALTPPARRIAPAPAAAAESPFEDVPDLNEVATPPARRAAPAPAAAAAAAAAAPAARVAPAAVADSSGDAELDALLAGL